MTMSRQKRILMILENSGYPEDTRVAMEANSLTDAGYQVSLICPTGKRKSRYELVGQVHVYRYPAPPDWGGFWGYVWEYGYSFNCAFLISWWVLFRRGFDAIHVHCPPDMNGVIGVIFRLLGKKFVMDLHDLSPELYQAQKENQGSRSVDRALRFFERLACRNAAMLIATNQTQQRIQIERGGAAAHRCYVIRNGPNEKFTNPVTEAVDLEMPGKTIVGYVGTMGVQDGVDYLVQAMRVIHQSRDDIHAVIVGEGVAVPQLKRLVAELGLDSAVTFTGFINFDDVPRYLAAFDICATPDPSNPYNDSCTTIKTMEYMALGKPTVAFRTPENELSAADSALYADSIEEFAHQIMHLADNPDLRQAMGRRGHQRIMDSLTWRHQERILLQAYADLFGNLKINKEKMGGNQVVNSSTNSSTNSIHSPDKKTVSLPHQRSKPTDSTLAPQAANELECQFPFQGRLSDFLEKALWEDMSQAQLSSSFRAYYRIRSFLPIRIRNYLQCLRNHKQRVDSHWYIPQQLDTFLKNELCPIESIWPDGADFAFVLTHDVEELNGFQRILEIANIEESLGLRSCWNIVPNRYPIDQGVIQELKDRGHEVAIHGWNHDGKLFWDHKTFKRRAAKINQAIADYRAAGFRAPMVHRNLNWMQSLEIEYDSSCFDVDPYQAMTGGVQNIWPFRVGNFVELPYTLPQDHTLFITLKETTTRIWEEKLEFIMRRRGMALMLTHPDYLSNPRLFNLYRRFLEQASQTSKAWHVLPGDLARWFLSNYCSPKVRALPELIPPS